MRKSERKRQLLAQARALIAAEGFRAATPGRRAELNAVLLECTEPLVRLLQAGQQAGVVRRMDAQVAAWELLQAVLGYALTGPRDVPAEEGEATQPLDTLLHGLLKTDV